jgi:hypothetical protein
MAMKVPAFQLIDFCYVCSCNRVFQQKDGALRCSKGHLASKAQVVLWVHLQKVIDDSASSDVA